MFGGGAPATAVAGCGSNDVYPGALDGLGIIGGGLGGMNCTSGVLSKTAIGPIDA